MAVHSGLCPRGGGDAWLGGHPHARMTRGERQRSDARWQKRRSGHAELQSSDGCRHATPTLDSLAHCNDDSN
jgi:hypothetical protein